MPRNNSKKIMKKQYQHSHLSSSLLYGLLIALFFFFSCTNPIDSNLNEPIPDKDVYIVYGYVCRNDLVVVNVNVLMYIKDYQYSPRQTSFFCKTDAQGLFKFTVDYPDWNRYYYNLTCELKQYNSKIEFGRVERIDFEL